MRADRIVVDDTTARASFELVVPRSLGHLQVRIDTAVVFEKDAARIVTRARPGATGDTYMLDLTVARGPRDTPVTRP